MVVKSYKYRWGEVERTKIYINLIKIVGCGFIISFALKYMKMEREMLVIFSLIYILSIPRLLMNQITEEAEYKKFIDVSNYMEQLLYSFRRHSKIAVALEDTLQIFPEGDMANCLDYALEHINESYTTGNTYEEALGMVEEQYASEMLRRIHTFIISVEMLGGNHEKGIDLLIQDSSKWVNRLTAIRAGKYAVKRNMSIAVVLAMLIVSSTSFMIPSAFANIQGMFLAQVAMLMTVLGNYLLWLLVQTKMTGSYISNDTYVSEEEVGNYRDKLGKYINYHRRKLLVLTFVFLCAIGYFLFITQYMAAFLTVTLFVLVLSQKYRSKKLAIKKLRREVLKAFPDWMLGIALQLQTENVQVAIEKSIDNAPYVLEEELELLVRNIERDPLGIWPYLNFYDELGLQELNSAMKMLYVMNQYGEEEMGQQIQTLVERNTVMQDASEKLKLEDYLSGMGVVILLPMLLGSGKMVIDMMLLVSELLSSTKGMM